MTKFMNWVVRHPIISVVVLFIVLAVLSVKILTIEIDSSAEGLMAEGDPERLYYESVKEKFGSDTLTVIVVEGKNGKDVFEQETLSLVETLTDKVVEIDGVTNIQSLTTVNKIKGEGDFLNTDKLIEEIPSDPEGLRQIKEDAQRNDVFLKNLISKDSKITGINIFTERKPDDKKFNERFSAELDRLISKHKGDYRVYQIGNPMTKVSFSSNIQKDQQTLIPWSVAFLIFLLLITLRSSTAAMLPIITGGLSILATLGFMTLIGYPINVITAIVPALLIAIGCTEDIHMISEYFTGLREGKNKKDAIIYMATKCGLPILLTSATTVLGFSSLAFNKITILKQFGIVASFGLSINFIISIIVIPSFLQFMPVPKVFKKEKPKKSRRYIDAFTDWFIRLNTKHRRLIVVGILAIVAVAVAGWFRLKVNTDFISYFKEGSLIRQRVDSIHNDLSGALSFNIVVETGKEDAVKDPSVLKQIAGLQEYMDGMGKFDKSISLSDYIRVMNKEMNAGKKEMQVIPDSKNLIAQYLLLMAEEDTKSYVDSDYSTANILVRHNITSSAELTKYIDEIQGYIAKNFSKDLSVRFTGEGVLINNAADYMAKGQATSLISSLLTIFAIMAFLFMSIRAGVISMIPNMVPIILNFGIMGWFGIPLNTGTCMVAAIALGIAVDDTTHFMARYYGELKKTNDQKQAILDSLRGEGEPVLLSSIALAAGFAILGLSEFNPTIQFGLLSAVVMLIGYVSEMLITPLLLESVQLVTLWDFLRVKLKKDITKISPIFVNLSKSEAKKVILLGSIRSASNGEYIIRQGEAGTEMYMIITGSVKATVEAEGKGKELGTLKEGDIVGEMAFVGGGTRSANIISLDETELLKIDYKSLERVRKRFPKIAAKLFMNISHILSDRLRAQNVLGTG
ncbi:MAG: MMPL family transporter [Nitrospirae bacterium]|nr:MMPL family transporter [Nitrospirota bacterium]